MVYRDPGDQDEGDLIFGTRVCKACDVRKPMSQFHWARSYRRRTCKSCSDEQRRIRKAEDPEKASKDSRRWNLNRRYDMTQESFNELYESQGGLCAICEVSLADSMHVDHDHSCCTGENTCGKCVRGLLCMSCNTGLGKFRDSRELLLKAAEYLR